MTDMQQHNAPNRTPARALLIAVVVLLAGLLTAFTIRAATDAAGQTTRLSVSSVGEQASGPSNHADVADSGQVVAFVSAAANLVADDTNGVADIFVHDRATGQTTRVSVGSGAAQADGPSAAPSVSADGRYVAFYSEATNLVAGDTNGMGDVFVHDRQTGQTRRVSVAGDGAEGQGKSSEPAISGDGRSVAFRSAAENLVDDDTNGVDDVFLHDIDTGQTQRVSLRAGGAQPTANSQQPSISDDGRVVAFFSYDRRMVSGDTNSKADVFVRDLDTATTTRVSVSSAGFQANKANYHLSLSGDGRYVAFDSSADNLTPGDTNGFIDVFVHDRQTGETRRISVDSDGALADDDSLDPRFAAGGRFVTFWSNADNLVPGPVVRIPHIFIYDLQTSAVARVSVSSAGVLANDGSSLPVVSGDGGLVVYESFAPNLVPQDTNVTWDIFAYEALGQISGTITDTISGEPVAGVLVSAGFGRAATTDEQGNYTIDSLIPGSYTLTPSKLGYSFEPPTRTVSLPPSAAAQDFSATGSQTYRLSGTVTDAATGEPLAEVLISDGGGREVQTDAFGVYVLDDVPAGDYVLTPSLPGYVFTPAARAVSVPDEEAELDFVGATTYHIYGRVYDLNTGAGIAGVLVSAGAGIDATTDADGNYQLNDLEPGTYQLVAIKSSMEFNPSTLSVTVPPNADGQDFTYGTPPPPIYELFAPVVIR